MDNIIQIESADFMQRGVLLITTDTEDEEQVELPG